MYYVHTHFLLYLILTFYSGVQKRNEIVSNLISSKKFCHSNKHVLSMDYLPTMRSICRAEKVKEQHSLRYFERKLLMLHEKCTYSNSLRFVQFMWFKHFFFFVSHFQTFTLPLKPSPAQKLAGIHGLGFPLMCGWHTAFENLPWLLNCLRFCDMSVTCL